MKTWFTLLMLLFASAALAQLDTSNTMRCGNRLVKEGDHVALVNGLCGEPAYVEQRTIWRYGPTRRSFRNLQYERFNTLSGREIIRPQVSQVQVPVNVWVYNFGHNRFMREVVFLDGKIEYIKRLGYGY